MHWLEPDTPEQSSPGGQFNIGLRCANGWGVDRDEMEAVKWYRLSAARGCERAQFNLAVACDHGIGTLPDPAQAAAWYLKAAAQGDPIAMGNTGLCYLTGRGVEQDTAEAFTWLASAVALGHTAVEPARRLALQSLQTGIPLALFPWKELFHRRAHDAFCVRKVCDHVACQAETQLCVKSH